MLKSLETKHNFTCCCNIISPRKSAKEIQEPNMTELKNVLLFYSFFFIEESGSRTGIKAMGLMKKLH